MISYQWATLRYVAEIQLTDFDLDKRHLVEIDCDWPDGDPRTVGIGGSAANQRIGPTWASMGQNKYIDRGKQVGAARTSCKRIADGRSI